MSSESIERLRQIQRRYTGTADSDNVYRIDGQDVAWLINEVEAHQRIVKELEARIQRLMTTREQAERFIRHHLSSAAWSGENLMVTFEQEELIAALIGDVEAPTPSLSDAIKEVESYLHDELGGGTTNRQKWMRAAASTILDRLKSLGPPERD